MKRFFEGNTSAVSELTVSSSLGEIPAAERLRIRELYLASSYPVTDRQPCIFAAAGNVAAGKTSLLRFLSAAGELPAAHAVRHDPDAVMSEIQAYRSETLVDPSAAFQRWEVPARLLADEILTVAIERRCDIVYDRTCAFPETVNLLRQLRFEENYSIRMFFVWADLDECLIRAERRARTSRRVVPKAVIIQRAAALRSLAVAYAGIANEFRIFENHDGFEPKHIGTLENGMVSAIIDEPSLERFLSEHHIKARYS